MAHVSGPSLAQLDDRGDRFAAEMRRALKLVCDEILPHASDLIDLNSIRTRWSALVRDELLKSLYLAWTHAAEDTYQQLLSVVQRVNRGRSEQPLSVTAAVAIPQVANELAELYLANATNRLFSVGNLVWNTAREQMVLGMKAGESITEIRNRLMDVANLAAPQAEVIARTEVIGASNAGSYAEMKATGLPAIKEWIAASDRRTRPSHEHVDGTEVDIDEKFIVGGYAMAYPHDPTGPASEVINCRCTLGWEISDDELLDEDDDMTFDTEVEVFHLPGRHDQKDHGRKGLRGLKAGKPLKITHGLVHKKHADGSIIAVTKDGKKHVLWEANKYHLREKDDQGLWQTKKSIIKSKAYKEINDFAPDWHEPDQEGDKDKENEKPEEKDTKKPTPKADAKPATDADAVPATDAVSPGDPLKITHGLVHKKHDANTTVTVNGANDKKVVWNGKEYDLMSKQSDGSWDVNSSVKKSKAYAAINDFDKDWRVPVSGNDDGDGDDAASTPNPAPVTPSAPPTPSTPPTPSAPKLHTQVTSSVPNKHGQKYDKGDKIKMSDDFVHQDFPNDSVVAISDDGETKKIIFKDGQFEVHRWSGISDDWQLVDEAPREKAAAMIDSHLTTWNEPIEKKASVGGVPVGPTTIPDDEFAELNPGPPINLTPEYMRQDFPDDSIIAVSSDGYSKVVISGDNVQIHEYSEEYDEWDMVDDESKEDSGPMIESYDGEWYEPVPADVDDDSPPEDAGLPALVTPKSHNMKDITKASDTPVAMTQEFIDADFPNNAVVAIAADNKHRLVLRNGNYEVQRFNKLSRGWTVDVSAPRDHPNMIAAIAEYSDDWREPALATKPATPPAPAPPAPTPPPAVSTPKAYTPMQKAYAQSIFGSNGVKWHTDSKKIYDAALEVSQKDPSLTMADALAIMDQSVKKTDNPFQTKMIKYLGTKAGKKYAQEKGGSAPIGDLAQVITPNPAAAGSPPTNPDAYKKFTTTSANNMQKEMDAAHPPPWTAAQRSALREYTGGNYSTLNKCLRGTAPCSPGSLSTIAGIKGGMKPSTRDMLLYRKTSLATFGVKTNQELEALTGNTFKDKGVISTSIEEGTWSGDVHMKIEAPKGSNLAWVAPISHYSSEKEFVLAPGTDFEVISVEPHWTQPNTRVMRVRIIPGSGDLS